MDDGSLRPGARFGRYTVISRLATGGMAQVWLAELSGAGDFQKKVVLKTMLPHLVESPEFVKMFLNEAALAARLDHPNIVHIYDLGELENLYFIAMEYVQGRSLRQIRGRLSKLQETMPVWFLLRVIAAVCEGLQYAHDFSDNEGRPLGLVHRDVSPENMMLAFNGTVKLLDFGVATAIGRNATKPGTLVGKFCYMSPERVHGARADRRSDIYSVGVILYEYLTGVRPFAADDEFRLLAKIAEGNVRDPRELVPTIPDELARILLKTMARNPNERYQEAEHVRIDVLNFLQQAFPQEAQFSLAHYICSLFSDSQEIPSNVKRSLAALRQQQKTRPGETSISLAPDALTARSLRPGPISGTDASISVTPKMPAVAALDQLDFDVEVVVDESKKQAGKGKGDAARGEPKPKVEAKAEPDAKSASGASSSIFDVPGDAKRAPAAAAAPSSGSGSASPEALEVLWRSARKSLLPQAPESFGTPARGTSTQSVFGSGTGGGGAGGSDEASSGGKNDVFSSSRGGGTSTLNTDVFTSYSRLKTPSPKATGMATPTSGNVLRRGATGWGPLSSKEVETGRSDFLKGGREAEAAKCFELGLRYANEGKYASALEEWEKAVAKEPDNRAYQTNLRRLKKLLEEKDNNGTGLGPGGFSDLTEGKINGNKK